MKDCFLHAEMFTLCLLWHNKHSHVLKWPFIPTVTALHNCSILSPPQLTRKVLHLWTELTIQFQAFTEYKCNVLTKHNKNYHMDCLPKLGMLSKSLLSVPWSSTLISSEPPQLNAGTINGQQISWFLLHFNAVIINGQLQQLKILELTEASLKSHKHWWCRSSVQSAPAWVHSELFFETCWLWTLKSHNPRGFSAAAVMTSMHPEDASKLFLEFFTCSHPPSE